MTRFEQISVTLSIIALIVAIGTPVATYLWLDPTVQKIQNKPDLAANWNDWRPGMKTRTLTGSNKGRVPVQELIVAIQTEGFSSWKIEKEILLNPPMPVKFSLQPGTVIMQLNRAFGPDEILAMEMPLGASSAHVYSEFGHALFIPTGGWGVSSGGGW